MNKNNKAPAALRAAFDILRHCCYNAETQEAIDGIKLTATTAAG